MRKTPVALYRMGNANSSRLDNVRVQDVETYEENKEVWVLANSGGISTFSMQGVGKNWWKLDQGNDIPIQLKLINDYANHWSWEPNHTMLMEEYKASLRLISEAFYKVS